MKEITDGNAAGYGQFVMLAATIRLTEIQINAYNFFDICQNMQSNS